VSKAETGGVGLRAVRLEEIVRAFQEATRKIMRRMARDEKLASLMYGTNVYATLVAAYVASLGKTQRLEKMTNASSFMDVEDLWATLDHIELDEVDGEKKHDEIEQKKSVSRGH